MPNRPHVLIVEDDVELRASIAELLKVEGYDIDLATNGAEAINYLENDLRPFVVVVDLLMPGIVGQELPGLSQAGRYDSTAQIRT